MTDEEKRLYQDELARAEESAKLRDEDYQLAYAVDIIKGLTVIAPDAP
jgi:carboxyl-terminal processing protease